MCLSDGNDSSFRASVNWLLLRLLKGKRDGCARQKQVSRDNLARSSSQECIILYRVWGDALIRCCCVHGSSVRECSSRLICCCPLNDRHTKIAKCPCEELSANCGLILCPCPCPPPSLPQKAPYSRILFLMYMEAI